MTDIFALTTRPDTELFFKRNEPGDPRLGEIALHLPDDYTAAKIVILGCPQDEGVRRNGGRVGAAGAPTEIRRALYKLVAKDDWEAALFDLGDTVIQATLEDTHAAHQRIVEQLLRDDKVVIILGGGNDISYPDASALSAVFGADNVVAFNIDAHLDVRTSPIRHSGTPYRQLLESGRLLPKQFYEIGTQPFSAAQAHLDDLRERGVRVVKMPQLRTSGDMTAFMKSLIYAPTSDYPAAFWGFDMDAVTAADAPGVSAPNPAGFRADEFLMLCEMAADATLEQLVVEFSEVNPLYDLDGRTSRLVAAGIWTIINHIL